MANQGGNNVMIRDCRKGNWTIQETMILIEAKKMDDERRMKSERGKPAELRWKWVEDYCWRKGCLRSQNQCNDKWDNLMRDFKKVREYERRVGGERSYWRIGKNDRKDKKLPSNMLPQIYDALVEVVEKNGFTGGSTAHAAVVGLPSGLDQPSMPYVMQHPMPAPTVLLPFPPPAQMQMSQKPTILPYSQPLPAAGSDTTEYSDSPSKRRRSRRGRGEECSGRGSLQEVGSAISKSASIIAEAIQSSEEREKRRHREIMSLHQRRLQIEESKGQINRQGFNGLVEAINKLANSIHSLASHESN